MLFTVASFEIGYLMNNNNRSNDNNDKNISIDSSKIKCYSFYFRCREVTREIGVDEWRFNAEQCVDFQKQVDELEVEKKKNKNDSDEQKFVSDDEKNAVKVKSQLAQFTTQRNSLVSNAIKRMIKASVEPKNNWLPRLKPSTTHTASTTHVNIIIDEIGSDTRVLRALAADREELAKRLHEYLFGEFNPPKERVRIHFVVAGTGANFAPEEAASENHAVSCLYLTPEKTIFKTLLEQNAPKFQSSPILKELYERLRNAADSTPSKPFEDPIESILADLITNARCAAILINQALKHRKVPTLSSGGVAPWIPPLTSVVETTIKEFAELNGLAKFYDSDEVISFALAFVALRFPEMPECPAIAEDVLRPKSLGVVKTLPNLLCTVSGLVVDTIRECPPESILSSTKIMADGPENFGVQGVLAFHLKRGRYECSPAFAAMFKFYLRNQGRKNWETLESNIADLCVLITKFSTSLKTVDDDLRKDHSDLYDRYFVGNRALLEKFDPLYKLKKEWLVYPESARVCGSSCEQLKRKMVEYIDTASEDEKKSIIEEYRGKIFGSSSSSTASNSTVVMISVEKEPFADVIVAGPGRLILLQCKRIDAVDKKISFENEFGKMGALDLQHAKDDDTKNETWRKSRKYVDFLKEFCKKNKDDPVEVFTAVILETGSETVLKNRRQSYVNKKMSEYKTNFAKLDLFSCSIKRNSAQSTSPLYPLMTVGFK